ncbi:CLUMA_CG003372, isoform A [Clunio marinus]|uniref:CLUMA_CG003372, isoform A n=1 Tax=Clunio marinus TaxID=568069 RepID=A0A1J1HTG5_9DIPT|nr:CLUMA_CG003372, isoform A [Clunio marinus]
MDKTNLKIKDVSKDKQHLKTHIPFIEDMVKRCKDTQYEETWKKMLLVISSDMSLSLSRIQTLEEKISKLKEDMKKQQKELECHLNVKIKEEKCENSHENIDSTNTSAREQIPKHEETPYDDLLEVIKTETPKTVSGQEDIENKKSVKDKSSSPKGVSNKSKNIQKKKKSNNPTLRIRLNRRKKVNKVRKKSQKTKTNLSKKNSKKCIEKPDSILEEEDEPLLVEIVKKKDENEALLSKKMIENLKDLNNKKKNGVKRNSPYDFIGNRKIAQLNAAVNELSKNGEPNPEEILKSFERILGQVFFLKFKTLLDKGKAGYNELELLNRSLSSSFIGEAVKATSSKLRHGRSFGSDKNENVKVKYELKECCVLIERLDYELVQTTVKIQSDGSFKKIDYNAQQTLIPLDEIKKEPSTDMMEEIDATTDSKPCLVSHISKFIQNLEIIVENISITNCRGGKLFKCKQRRDHNCNFESFDEEIFKYHIQSKHFLVKWSGFCETCKKSVSNINPLLEEYFHIKNCHNEGMLTEITEIDQNKSQWKVGEAKNGELNKLKLFKVDAAEKKPSTVVANVPKLSEKPSEVPKLSEKPSEVPKLSEKPSDVPKVTEKPSNVQKLSEKPPEVSEAAEKPPEMSETAEKTAEETHPPTTTSEIESTTKLRPWLNMQDSKTNEAITHMLKHSYLFHLYKCMGSSCSLTTNNPKTFTNHLSEHKISHNSDIGNFGSCAYCSFKTFLPKKLVIHIESKHSTSKFSCSKCFFRAISKQHVLWHYEVFHELNANTKQLMVLECIGSGENDINDEINNIRLNLAEHVPPIICASCKNKSFNKSAFITHLIEKHPDWKSWKNRCKKCHEDVDSQNIFQHLETCHQIFRFQCAFCVYGCEELKEIRYHLMNFHSNERPFFCERVKSKYKVKNDPTNINNFVTLKLMEFKDSETS